MRTRTRSSVVLEKAEISVKAYGRAGEAGEHKSWPSISVAKGSLEAAV